MTFTPHLDDVQRIHHDLSQPALTSLPSIPMPADRPASQSLPELLLFSESLAYAPSFEEMLDVYLQNFTGRGIPKSHPIHTVNLDVILSREELAGRSHLPIRVPLFHICDRCGGSGRAGFFGCDRCNGAGILEELRTLDVIIPPIGPEGAIIPLSLRHLGIENLNVNLRIAVHA
ncbi:MAG TPA: hypothetical protein VHP11_02820 [Tepidisphaeraceae bacterium]|nr:hypothetical protein [Tepidisphaeraceae bacterium]